MQSHNPNSSLLCPTAHSPDRPAQDAHPAAPEARAARWLLPLAEIEAGDRASVGNKAWYLSRLVRAGLPVPPGLAIRREAGLAALSPDTQHSEPVQQFWQQLELMVARTFQLEEGVAVRSSSPTEDGECSSQAGQFATVLHVKSPQALRQALETCWKSAKRGGAPNGIGVVIQAMINADLAGVAFSRAPVAQGAQGGLSGDGDAVSIEFTVGTAENLVSGSVVGCRANVTGEDIRMVSGAPPLAAEQRAVLCEVARVARQVEHLFGFPVDMEWAARGGRPFFVQARPITGQRGEGPAGTWTRHIAEDLWADPLTSFEEALLVSLSPKFDLREPGRWAGIHIPKEARVLTGIGCYLYLNCALLEEVAKILPRAWRIDPIIALFPPGRGPQELPPPEAAQLARALAGAAALGLLSPDANPLTSSFRGHIRSRALEAEARGLGAVEVARLSDQLLATHLERCTALLGKILAADQFVYLWAFAFSWLVEWTGRTLGLPRESWLRHLGGTGRNATERMAALMEEAGEGIRASGVEISGRTFDAVVADLAARGYGQAASAARLLLSDFGVRASQRSLIEPRWAEAPLVILERARRFARPGPPRRPASRGDKLPLRLRIALRLANRQLDLREDQRLLIDAALFAIRRAVLEVGQRYSLASDVFFLRPEEVGALLAGRLDTDGARARAKVRHAQYCTASPPPAFWVDGHPVRGNGMHLSGKRITGVGASPGIATGRVRIVERLDELPGVESGDLVVAPLMGPAWAPILRSAGGVITEKGGLLDHFAILAREAAVPAVTAAEGAIAALKGVERATIDGTRGVISW